ncbi:MAG TPA: transglutaminase-like domain-containing protein, partial [Clostridia bacterium]|nr:transglutaminase-like domain-containing protein [Clostridia bacterium]
LESGLEVTVSKDAPFHFAFEHIATADPELSQTAYGACYKWRWQNLPAYKESLPLAPERQPKLALSTFPDWQTFGQWYSRIIQLTDEATPEIDAKAKELTGQAKTDRDKVLALYNYVTALRYVAVPMGVSSFRPHSAVDVLQNQFGDCKDKATLFNTLLRSIGLQARLVLVPRFGTAHDSVPGMSFNHAISQVIVDGQPLWIDTTDDVCRFGMLPPGDPGRKVLVIDNNTTGLIKLPAPQAKDHQLKIEGSMNCAQFNQPARLRIRTVALGFPDYQLRAGARETDNNTALLPLLGAMYRPTSGSYSLDRQTKTPISALDQDFVWTAEGTAVGMLSSASGNGLVHAPFWVPKEWDAALHTRSAPLFLNSGYPLTLDQDMTITIQEGGSAVSLPALSENQTGPLRWKVVWQKVSPGKLSARLTATLDKGELEIPEVRVFQEQLRALLAAVAVPAVVSPTQPTR